MRRNSGLQASGRESNHYHRTFQPWRVGACLLFFFSAAVAAQAQTYRIDVLDFTVPEIGVAGVQTLGRLQGCTNPVTTVAYDITLVPVGTGAQLGQDYGPPAPAQFTFGPGADQTFVFVPLFDDNLVEGTEVFDVVFTPQTPGADQITCAEGVLTPAAPSFSGRITITDDESTDLSIADFSVLEGDAGLTNVQFNLQMSVAPDNPISVNLTFADNTAMAGVDYRTASGTVTFNQGIDNVLFTLPLIIGDTVNEQDETFFVNLGGVTAPEVVNIVDGQGVVTILNDDGAGAVLSIDDVSISEGDEGTTTAVFTVRRGGTTSGVVLVDFATVDGTATTADGDYESTAGQLRFDPGVMTQSVAVTISGDRTVEPDETFIVRLANPTNGAEIIDGDGEGTILNDDEEETVLTIADVEVLEGDTDTVDAVLTVTLSAPSGAPVRVDFATADGTASAAEGDYTVTSGTLTFMPGETSQNVVVTVNGDTRVEVDETFNVDLSNPAGATIMDGQGVVTIRDDDEDAVLPELSIADISLAEGNAGTRSAIFTVTLSAAAAEAVRVDFSTADGTATTDDSDYRSASGTLTLAAGETSATITVAVIGDTQAEGDETFFVNLSAPINATIADGQGQATITNDDAAPSPSLSIGNANVSEGDAGSGNAVLVITLSAASTQAVMVSFATQDGTATAADGDYVSTAGSLTLAAGQTSSSIAVQVNGDDRDEGDETFAVTLSNAQGATISDGIGQVTIRDDDQDVALSEIRLVDVPTVSESDGTALILAERLAPTSAAVQVTISATAGSATAGEDFTATQRILSWGPGEGGTRRFAVAILDDSVAETDETVRVALSAPVGALLGGPASGEIIIVDDDAALELTAISDPEQNARVEEAVALQVRVSRDDGSPVAGLVVTWALEGDASFEDGNTSTTRGDGAAAKTVRLGDMPGTVAVTASLAGAEAPVAFRIEVDGNLGDLFSPDDESAESSVADVLDEGCGDATGTFNDLCEYVFELEPDEQREVIGEIAPQETAVQGEIALTGLRVQLGNVGARLAALRGDAARQAASNLALNIQGDGLGVAALQTAAAHYGAAETWAQARLEQALRGAASGGGASADDTGSDVTGSDVKAYEAPRLGVFVSGRLSVGERPTSSREAGFELDSQGLTAGLDYLFTNRFVFGVAVGYLDTDSDLDDDGGGLEADGYSLSAYGVYQRDRFYVDGALTYGRNDYALTRNIDLAVSFAGQRRYTARADTESDQTALSLGLGYDWTAGALQIGGRGRISYLEADIDGYTERGAGPFNLVLRDQTLESLLSEVGLELGYAASLSWGVLQPTVRFSYLHEFEDDGRLIRGRFERDVLGGEFAVPTNAPDRDFFNLGAGLTAVFPHNWSAYLLYDTDLERDDLDLYTLSGGVRLQF